MADNTLSTRRRFLHTTAALFPAIVPASVFGAQAPSNRVNLAAFGVGGRGTADTGAIRKHPAARFVAVCDGYQSRAERKQAEWNKAYGGDYVKIHKDPREAMARPDVDAVVIATPDHWHTPLAIMAARAGKDMYVEKPLSVAMKWSWRLRELVKAKQRIFQYGTQQRSDKRFRYACELARHGALGEIKSVHAWCPDASQQWEIYGGKPSLSVPRYGSMRPIPVPKDLDFDLWCGPSPMRPYTADRCTPFGTYHIYDYALGFIAGWGAHPLDIAQWGLGTDHTGPLFFEGTGVLPKYGLLDTTEEWDIHCTYANGVVMRFMDERAAKAVVGRYRPRWTNHGTTFFGTEGWVSVDRSGIDFSKESLRDVKFDASAQRLYESTDHHKNFIDCVLERKQTASPLEAAIRSDTISHISDLVVRLKRPIEWDPVKEMVKGDLQAAKMLDRPMRPKWAV
jgi:predicted dehydrogenase